MPYVGKAMDRRRNRRLSEELAKTAVLDPGAVSCPRCESPAGISCKSPIGLYTKHHKVRRRLALEITRDIALGRLVPRSGIANHAQPCACDHCTGQRLRDFDG